MKKIICLLLVALFPVLCFSGCGKTGSKVKYDKNSAIAVLESGVVAENKSYELSFDSSNSSVSLLCKKTGKVWSTCPADKKIDDDEKSAINIRVQDLRMVKEFSLTSFAAKRIASEKIENGVKITYYFDKYKIAVPVCYTLRDDSLLISITGSDIIQTATRYAIIAAQPAPMLARVSVKAKNSYLFLAYGIGGIVNNRITADEALKVFGGPLNIASMAVDSLTNSSDSCECRCFGVKDNEDAALYIAEETAGAVSYNMLAGDVRMKYSVVNPTLYFVDYDYFYGVSKSDGLLKQISDTFTDTVSVGFYPLSGKQADYNGMAKCYRNYLIKNGYLDKNKSAKDSSPYSVTYVGGVMEDESVAGLPTENLKVLTDFSAAKKMTEKLAKDTGIMTNVRLSGYGSTGINIGEIAGGYEIPSDFGNDSERKDLYDYIKSDNSEVYNDFSVIYYRKSGGGFSYSRSATKTAIHHVAEITPVNVPMRDFNEALKYHLLSRDNLTKAIEKLIDFAGKNNISGISFNDLGRIWYSDYTNGVKYAVCAKIDTDCKKYLESVSKSGHSVAVSGGSYYSTGLSDVVFDAPVEPSGRNIYYAEIPFYQMVFHGVTPMYTSALNTAADVKYNTMLAASSGTGLGFSFINDYDPRYSKTDGNKLFAMRFEDNSDVVKTILDKYADVYKKVAGSKIVRYDILKNDITKTTFENGVCIYANHSSATRKSPVGKIAGYDYVLGGEED